MGVSAPDAAGPGGGQGGRTDDFSENEVSDGVSTSGCSGVVPGNAALAGCACSSAVVVVERAWRFPFKLIATLERVRERRLDLEWSKGSSLDPGSMRIRANSLNDALLFKVDWLKEASGLADLTSNILPGMNLTSTASVSMLTTPSECFFTRPALTDEGTTCVADEGPAVELSLEDSLVRLCAGSVMSSSLLLLTPTAGATES